MPASVTPTKSSGLRIWVGLVEERWTGFGPAISRPSGPNQGLGPLGSFTDCCPWPRLRPPDLERSFNILKIKWTTLKNLHEKEPIIFRHMDLLLIVTFFQVCSGLAVKLLACDRCTCPPLLGIWPLSDPPLVSPTDRLSLKREWRTNSRCIQKARDHETQSTGGRKVWSLSTTIHRHFATSNKQLNNWL